MSTFTTKQLRDAIIAALPNDTSLHGRPPEPRHVYVPPSHIKALRLESALVIGGRGVGKSFWGAALRDASIRKMLGEAVPNLPDIKVYSGYGEKPDRVLYPDSETFASLLDRNLDAYHVWRAVVARWAASIVGTTLPNSDDTWDQTAHWVRSNPESFARLVENANQALASADTHGLIIFDALDRISNDWATMDNIVRDLLRLVLILRPFTRLHAKVFLREDQFNGRLVANFPDASKLQTNRVELTWAPHDLHGLLWQYLLNADAPHGDIMRRLYEHTVGKAVTPPLNEVWQVPESAKREGDLQRLLFNALAGRFMGQNQRRGFTYTWSVKHLADSHGRTTPRSFLAGILAAAEDSIVRYPDYPYPLHYESIKRGVQKASAIRVDEMAEDYPWVKQMLDPLNGLVVPCEAENIDERWQQKFGENPNHLDFGRLPPEHVRDGWKGIRSDLVTLAIFETMKDGRLNMPDLYRVGFSLGRKGGVKPMAKASP